MNIWETSEVKFLADNLHLGTKEICLKYCDQFGSEQRTYDSIQKKVKKLRDAYGDEPDDTDLQEVIDQVDKLLAGGEKLLIPDVNAQRKRELKDEAKWWLEGIIESSSSIEFTDIQATQGTGTSLCVLISDSHIGKQNNHYNLEIAKQRIDDMPNKILSQEGNIGVDEVVLLFAGDLIEGEDIFRTQAHHLECPAIEQVQIASESFWNMILKFHQFYDCPVRVVTVPGNHGRMSRTANEKTNWDNVIYHILKVMAQGYGNDNIIIDCNFDQFKVFDVKDKKGMLYHQGVKHTGTPSMREKVAGWSSRKQFDFMCHGHWHEWHVGNWLGRFVIANGCLCGPDDLAERMAKEDTARQAYFFVSPGMPLYGFGVIEWPE